jgi:hypothetical protein
LAAKASKKIVQYEEAEAERRDGAEQRVEQREGSRSSLVLLRGPHSLLGRSGSGSRRFDLPDESRNVTAAMAASDKRMTAVQSHPAGNNQPSETDKADADPTHQP